MSKYSLLVFDWDGTLIDSKAQIVNCMQATILSLSLDERSDKQISDIIGLGLEEAIRSLYPDISNEYIQKSTQTYREHYLTKDKTLSPLFDGTIQVLDDLKASGFDLAIATGKSRRGLNKGLIDTGLEGFFPVTRCADETRSKPHPQMLEEILVDHNVEPNNTLMIGDSEYDLQLANNTKVDALAVSYGVHGLMRLLKQGPVGFIDDIKQLPQWLNDHT
ncbi:MAG: phosphoglycolate phosphatase [Cocleimonas sp.]|jgi:phosphoglycolate phosphatase